MRAALFFVLVALAAVNAQINIGGRINYITLDDFTVGAGSHEVEVTLNGNVREGDDPVTGTDSFSSPGCNGLLGCARDMSMTVLEGENRRTSSSNIFPVENSEIFSGEWAVSNPKNFRSLTVLQYDGADNTIELDTTGLGGMDLTAGGVADGLRATIISDLETVYQIEIFDMSGNRCEINIESNDITGNDYDLTDIVVEVDFDDFDGNCDLSNVGSVQISLPSFDALDAIMRSFRVIGPVVEEPSASPTPAPSASRTPVPSPIVEECMCHCPIFTCALIFDPDDDENNAYYFDDDDERAGLRPPVNQVENDDDNQIVIPVVDDDDDASGSESGAAGVVASIAVLLVVALAL